MIHGVNTLNTRKPKFKMTKAITAQWQLDWREHNAWLKRQHLPKISFEEYCDSRLGKAKKSKHVPMTTLTTKTVYRRETPYIPSLSNYSNGTTKRVEPRVYSGERTLLGIATMHKSNMVPVFSQEEATEISRMRRG
jgi:hypothetical protein